MFNIIAWLAGILGISAVTQAIGAYFGGVVIEEATLGVTFVVGAEAADTINIAGSVRSGGAVITVPVLLPWYQANDAAGLIPTTVAQDGAVAIGTDGALIQSVAKLSGFVISSAAGLFDIDITDAGVFTTHLVIVMPDGRLQISGAITFA